MSAASFTANLAAYVLQTALLMLVGLLLPKLFGMSDPRVRLRYWHALLTVSLLLPFAWLAWRPQAPAARSFTGVLAGGMELDVRAGAASEHLSPWILVPVALAIVAVARALWLGAGLMALERLRRRGRPLDPLPEPFDDASRTLFVEAEFRTSRSVSTPLTFGWLRPVVLLPEAVVAMSPEEQRCVALHELLHVRRRDWLATLAEEALRALLWFHPAVWLMLDRVSLSREQVVDREVVSLTEARRTYMNTLSAMARTRYPAAAVAILPFFHRSHLLQRLALLTQEVSMSKLRWRLSLAASAGVLLLAGVVAARAFPLLHSSSALTGNIGAVSQSGRYLVAIHTEPGPTPKQCLFVAKVLDNATGESVMEPHIVTNAGTPAEVTTDSVSGPHFSLRISFDEGATEASYLFKALDGTKEIQHEEGRVALPSARSSNVYGLDQDGLTQPKLVRELVPVRPIGLPGKIPNVAVVVELVVNIDGLPEDLKIMKSAGPELDEASLKTLAQARWEPARLNGQPVSVRMPFTIGWGTGSEEVEPDSAAPPAAGSKTYTVEDGVKEPKVLNKVAPVYPSALKEKGVQGRVVLEVVINEEGKPWMLRVLKSDDEGFNQAALDAVKQWRWEPPMLHGKPVSLRWTLTINFKLS